MHGSIPSIGVLDALFTLCVLSHLHILLHEVVLRSSKDAADGRPCRERRYVSKINDERLAALGVDLRVDAPCELSESLMDGNQHTRTPHALTICRLSEAKYFKNRSTGITRNKLVHRHSASAFVCLLSSTSKASYLWNSSNIGKKVR